MNPGRIAFGLAAVAVPAGFVLFGLFIAIKQIAQKRIEDWRDRTMDKDKSDRGSGGR
jgi:hypothetical protein